MNTSRIALSATLLFLLPVATPIRAAEGRVPEVQELVARCAAALSRSARIDRVSTLRIAAVYPDHGEAAIPFELRRPNSSHSPRAGLAFDGEKACWLRGRDGESAAQPVPSRELVDFDVEIAWYFPAFFDRPAAYAGIEEVSGRKTHKLSVALPHGAVIVYFLDAKRALPVRATATFTLDGRTYRLDRRYDDFREVGGILYPHRFTYPSREGGSLWGRIASLEVDPAIDDARFTVPEHCRMALPSP